MDEIRQDRLTQVLVAYQVLWATFVAHLSLEGHKKVYAYQASLALLGLMDHLDHYQDDDNAQDQNLSVVS